MGPEFAAADERRNDEKSHCPSRGAFRLNLMLDPYLFGALYQKVCHRLPQHRYGRRICCLSPP
jgi:hypothetical protein